MAKSGTLPPGFFWTDADNIDVPMTTDELTALEAAMQQNMVLQGFKIHERQRQMKEEVDNSRTIRRLRITPWAGQNKKKAASARKQPTKLQTVNIKSSNYPRAFFSLSAGSCQ
ncbi:DUF4376 domain-containing protein [Salmonella enterica]